MGLYLQSRMKKEIGKRLEANQPINEIWIDKVMEHPEKEAAIEVETGCSVNFRELNQSMNKYTNHFSSIGYKHGDVIALFMENSIDFIAAWLGLSKIGVISAFINTNLKLEPLANSINVSNAKCVITTATLFPNLEKAKAQGLVRNDLKAFVINGDVQTAENLALTMAEASEEEPTRCPDVDFQSVLCYIYTSGTTGYPKPSVIRHCRYYCASISPVINFGVKNRDRVYITLPFYHSAAAMLGVGTMISMGSTIIIRKRFSASNFWKDAVTHDCTCAQYIGELCRYLLAQQSTPEEKHHKVRTMYGNGLRRELWAEFTTRFGIRRIGEMYGSTEGIANIVNIDNHIGSCGFLPIHSFRAAYYPVRLVKVDEETGELIRDADGLAVQCKPGQTGEIVGIINDKEALRRFDGYIVKQDTEKKIYRDVSTMGDQVFASSDILHRDEFGYLYFKDRTGDSFRWKGENVSTTEIESVLQPIKIIVDCTVYGVKVGSQEGRAGMAALQMVDGADIEALLSEVTERFTTCLASYAIPLFIRVCKEVDKTGTYKLRKMDLQRAGFDLTKMQNDPIFVFNSSIKKYVQLTPELQENIDSGECARF